MAKRKTRTSSRERSNLGRVEVLHDPSGKVPVDPTIRETDSKEQAKHRKQRQK